MSTDIAVQSLPALGMAKYGSEADFNEMVKASFLPRVQVCTGTTKIVQEGKIKPGTYALVRGKDDIVDLGETFNCLVFAMRYAAMNFSDINKPDIQYDPNSEQFKSIRSRSGEANSNCSAGPQFLIYLPDLKEYATFFFGSTSAKPEARKVKQRMDHESKAATFIKPNLLSNNKGRWHVPVVIPCTNPLAGPSNPEEHLKVGEKFLNPDPTEAAFETEPAVAGEAARPR